MSAKEKILLRRIRLLFFFVVVLFSLHTLIYPIIRREIWPLASMPMFSGNYISLCSTIYRLEVIGLDQEDERVEIPLQSLYNHMTTDYEYVLGYDLVVGALQNIGDYRDILFDQLDRHSPHQIDQVELWLGIWNDIAPMEFTRLQEPSEKTLVGRITRAEGQLINMTSLPQDQCLVSYFYRNIMNR